MRDARPAPALDGGGAGPGADRRAVRRAEREERRQRRAEIRASPVVERREVRAGGPGMPSSRPAAISASPECRATTGGQPAAAASAATMPNASGKIEGTTHASASASRWTRCRCSSAPVNRTSGPACASSARRGPRRTRRSRPARRGPRAPRAAGGRPCCASACRSRRPSDGRRAGSARGGPHSPRPGGAPRRCRGSADPGAPPSEPRPACRSAGCQSSTSTPGGTSWTRSTCPQTSSSTRPICAEPTNVAVARASVSRPHPASAALPRIAYSSSEPCALTA